MRISEYHLSEAFEDSRLEGSCHLISLDRFKSWKGKEKWHIVWNYPHGYKMFMMCFTYRSSRSVQVKLDGAFTFGTS
jgi:hypothetical protein